MDIFKALILGVVQGLTEFLPVSSSFHLRLVPALLNWPEVGIGLSAFLHLGTLLAVVIYFREDLTGIAIDGWRALFQPNFSPMKFLNSLAGKILLGTIPAVLIGYFFNEQLEQLDNNFYITSSFLVLIGLFLWFCDQKLANSSHIEKISKREAVTVGLGQALALIPGVSRSGSTISVGRLIGLNRKEAARFSFLLGVPVIFAAGILETLKFFKHGTGDTGAAALTTGLIAATLVGYLVIGFFLRFLENSSLLYFVIYRLVVGIGVLACLFTGVLKI